MAPKKVSRKRKLKKDKAVEGKRDTKKKRQVDARKREDKELHPQILRLLKERFGFACFRWCQEAAIFAALKGQDSLVVMPTGAGKSLCYAFPSAVKRGLTIVVSPLIALMQDQVAQLSTSELKCDFVTSTRTGKDRERIFKQLISMPPKIQILFVAPELLITEGFLALIGAVYEAGHLSLVAVDEAHCISTWGHDFRPAYRKLAVIRCRFKECPIMALTATACQKVRNEIVQSLRLCKPSVLRQSLNRPNIHYSVVYLDATLEDPLHVLRSKIMQQAVGGKTPSTIVYVRKQDTADDVADYLKSVKITCESYHAGLAPAVRSKVLNDWQKGDIQVVSATVAFGMGIDKPDVRLVVHYNMPKSMSSFYQESGRCGRDGKKANSIILYGIEEERKLTRLLQMPPGIFKKQEKNKKTDKKQRKDNTGGSSKDKGVSGEDSRVSMNQIAGELAKVAGRKLKKCMDVGKAEREVGMDELGLDVKIEREWDPEYGKKARKRRLDAFDEVVNYCLTSKCRREMLMDHFGESIEPSKCRKGCDVCLNPKKTAALLKTTQNTRIGGSGEEDSSDPDESLTEKWARKRIKREYNNPEEAAARNAAKVAQGGSEEDFWAKMEEAEKKFYGGRRQDTHTKPSVASAAVKREWIDSIECFCCGKLGHMSYDCPEKRTMSSFGRSGRGGEGGWDGMRDQYDSYCRGSLKREWM